MRSDSNIILLKRLFRSDSDRGLDSTRLLRFVSLIAMASLAGCVEDPSLLEQSGDIDDTAVTPRRRFQSDLTLCQRAHG